MKIKIEQRHIDTARDCHKKRYDCPVALAVNEVLADGYRACVYQYSIEIEQPSGDETSSKLAFGNKGNLPKWIKNFDSEIMHVDPFEFELDIPEYVIKKPEKILDVSVWVREFLRSIGEFSDKEVTYED